MDLFRNKVDQNIMDTCRAIRKSIQFRTEFTIITQQSERECMICQYSKCQYIQNINKNYTKY